MNGDGKPGLRERLTLIAHVMPTWTAEVVIAVTIKQAMGEVAAWLRDEADRLAGLWESAEGGHAVMFDDQRRAIQALADTIDPKETSQ